MPGRARENVRGIFMYAFLNGIIDEITESGAVIDVGGVGYNVQISPATAFRLPGVGRNVKLYTYTSVREDQIALYGFLSRDELALFKRVITVSGIGPKGGQALLSAMSADDLRFAIISGDVKAISRAPGIGKKTAERLILDLKDKLSAGDYLGAGYQEGATGGDGFPEAAGQDAGEVSDAAEALAALGYPRTDAVHAVRSAAKNGVTGTEELIKAALKELL